MPNIRPISDLRNNSNEISEFCRVSREPVFITKNGVGDMVVVSIEMYEQQQAQLELYAKLAEAEAESGKGEEIHVVAEKIRKKLVGKYHGDL
jgi:prevent-host-death family protein